MYDSTVYFYSAPVFIFFNCSTCISCNSSSIFRRNTKILQYYIYAIFNIQNHILIRTSNSLFCLGQLDTAGLLLACWRSFFFFFSAFLQLLLLTKKVKVHKRNITSIMKLDTKSTSRFLGYLK